FVVLAGALEAVNASDKGETLITVHRLGQFTGEGNMLSGRPSLVRTRVVEPGGVIQLERDRLLPPLQIGNQLREPFLPALILRRVELIAHSFGDVVVVGSVHCAGTLRVKEFLTRNGHPYTYIDLDRESDIQAFLDRFHVTPDDIPVLICRGETVLKNPTNQQIAECLGFNATIDQTHLRDVVIVGAGPAGLATPGYPASPGLDVLGAATRAPGR